MGGTGGPDPNGPSVLGTARAVAELAAQASDEIEAGGRLTEPVAAALTEGGLDHLYLPASAGGPQADPITGLMAMETLAVADGSTAWCAQVSSANAWQIATLSPEAVEAMTAQVGRPPRRFSGSNRPCGTARMVEGGYVVSGQWDFASNCLHADWYCGTCVVEDGGRRRHRSMFMPITDGTILPTWQVAGMRGTGSNDFAVTEVFVPMERVSAGRHLATQRGPLYNQRLPMVVNWALTAGVALGVARGAMEDFARLSADRTAGTDLPLRERAPVQLAAGRAEARLGAARAYCQQAIADAWGAAGGTDDPAALDAVIPPARLAIVHAMYTAVEVVDLLFQAGGTRSIFQCHGLERRFRDAHVALQHGAGSANHFEAGGRIALGLPAAAPLW
jgi:indole-3-acetate monooxygenase